MKYLKDKIKFNKSKKFGLFPCKKKSYLKRFLVHQFKKNVSVKKYVNSGVSKHYLKPIVADLV